MKSLFLFVAILTLPLLGVEDPPLFVVTVPKSGTYLTAKAIRGLTGISIGGTPMNHSSFSKRFVESHPHIKTTVHLMPQLEALKEISHAKKILVIRDPRDVIVSATYWLEKNDWYSHTVDHTRFYQADFEGRITYMIDFPKKYAVYSIKGFFERALTWFDRSDVLIVRFEDLIGPNGGGSSERQLATLRALCHYLEVDVEEERIQHIARTLWGRGGTFRKGKVGSWREVFTPYQKMLCKSTMGDLLIALGYEKDLEW